MTQQKTVKEPKQKRAKDRVAKILAATNRLLAKATKAQSSSLDDITTTNIAREAGVPVGSVYQYFHDRDAILEELYHNAYKEIEIVVCEKLLDLRSDSPFDHIALTLFHAFLDAARTHPTYRILTRWCNRLIPLSETTPKSNRDLAALVQTVLASMLIQVAEEKMNAVVRTISTTVSMVMDLAIEEESDMVAKMLVDELARMISSYTETYKLDT